MESVKGFIKALLVIALIIAALYFFNSYIIIGIEWLSSFFMSISSRIVAWYGDFFVFPGFMAKISEFLSSVLSGRTSYIAAAVSVTVVVCIVKSVF